MLDVVVLAGGLATRLRPMTAEVPKALLDVAGEPFVIRQLRYLKGQGIARVVLCVGFLGEQVQAVVGDGRRLGLKVEYSFDGPRLLGTGGAIKNALPLLGDAFFVLNGDSFLPIDFGEVERAFHAGTRPALMTVFRNENRWDVSNVSFEDGEIVEYNKRAPAEGMAYIDYGLSIVSSRLLAPYPDGESFDLGDVLHDLSVTGQVGGFEVFERFYEIGSREGLARTESYFQRRGNP